jgi:hypothetical protein
MTTSSVATHGRPALCQFHVRPVQVGDVSSDGATWSNVDYVHPEDCVCWVTMCAACIRVWGLAFEIMGPTYLN